MSSPDGWFISDASTAISSSRVGLLAHPNVGFQGRSLVQEDYDALFHLIGLPAS